MDILINSLIQISVFIVAVYVVGFIIALINKTFYRLAGYSRGVVYGTALIGTPIHELSHAFFCIVFAHKITEIKLFQIDEESGCLGYVNHTWNPKNLYQQIGNFFIGTAPILVGTAFLMVMMWLITPITFANVSEVFKNTTSYQGLFKGFGNVIRGFFMGYSDWKWWLYLILVILVALHMTLSKADLKGTIVSIPIICIVLVLLNVIFYFIPGVYSGFNNTMIKGELLLILTLFMAVIFSLLSLVPGLIIYLIRKLARRA